MEKAEGKIQAKCVGGNQTYSCCMKIDCKHPASMCIEQSCECHKSHPFCINSPTILKVKNSLQAKGKSYLTVLREVHKWYETQIKLFTIEMEEIRKLIDNYTVSLGNNQQKLYSYLMEGKSELILPALVAEVVGSVSENPSVSLQNLKKELDCQQIKIKKVLREVKQIAQNPILELPTLQKTMFVKQLCHPGIQILNSHTVKSTEDSWKLALLPVDLDGKEYKFKTLKYKFKLNNLEHTYFMIGVIQLPQNLTINDTNTHNKLENGSLTYLNSVFLGNSEGHRKQVTNITAYATNDEVEVQYERVTEKVTVRNITKNQHNISFIKTRADLPLYVALQINNLNDQVQLTRVSYTQ